jgi:Type II secretory pathway, component PulC
MPTPESIAAAIMRTMGAVSIDAARARQRLDALYTQYGQWPPKLVAFALLLALAWLGGSVVWSLVPAPRAAAWSPPAAAAAPSSQPDSENLVAGIVNAHLFGQYQAPPPAAPKPVNVADLANAPETHLDLTLLGILANRDAPQSSRAVISSGGGEDKPYALGQEVASGATLKAIFPDRVVLLRKGKPETLRLARDGSSSSGDDGGDVNTPIAVSQAEPVTGDMAQQLGAIRQRLLGNPAMAGQYLRIRPGGRVAS